MADAWNITMCNENSTAKDPVLKGGVYRLKILYYKKENSFYCTYRIIESI